MKSKITTLFFALFIFQFSFNTPLNGQVFKKYFLLTPYIGLNSYSWKEFDTNGNTDLTESGFIFSLGANAKYAFTRKKNLFAEADFHTFFGKVDYEGFLQDLNTGTREPYKNKTGYFGLEFMANFHYQLKLDKKFYLTPFGGFGIEYWRRDLDDGGKFGYIEKYTVVLFNIAGQGTYKLNKKIELFAILSFKIPLSISEYVDASDRGNNSIVDINLSPGKNPRVNFELGSYFYNFYAALYFETWTLSRSGIDKGFLQPESTRKWLSLKAGYTFNL